MNIEPYLQRRKKLLALMQQQGGGIAILPTAPEVMRNSDSDYPYRHDSSFYYLSGFPEPEAWLVLIANDQPQSLLFCRDKHDEREIWDGYRYGPNQAAEVFGFDAAYSITQFDAELPKLIANQSALYYAIGSNNNLDDKIRNWLGQIRSQSRSGTQAPARVHDLRHLVDEMRLFKDTHEIESMRQAAHISAQAHRRAMQATRPGKFEYEIEAELLYAFKTAGSPFPAYGSIVATGANACILHYRNNNAQLLSSDLLLIDAGCEFNSYASDITRVFPVNGKFSGAQRALYELVLTAQTASIAAAQPNNSFIAPHDAAVNTLAQGMLDLGLLQGSLNSVLEQESYRQFYMHRTSHWLGMDVHDVGDYREPNSTAQAEQTRPWRKLQPNMVLTIEPGLYVRPTQAVPEAYWNIGIRIEDDVLITPNGNETLSKEAPKTISEIEALMKLS